MSVQPTLYPGATVVSVPWAIHVNALYSSTFYRTFFVSIFVNYIIIFYISLYKYTTPTTVGIYIFNINFIYNII